MSADPRDRDGDGRVSMREGLYAYMPHPHIALRRGQGPVKVADQHKRGNPVQRFNATLAVWITRVVGTMYCFYLFNLLASTSAETAFASGNPTTIVNWMSSNWIQLVLLPAIIVGQNLAAEAADRRAEATFVDAEAVLHEAQQIQQHLAAQDAALQAQDQVLADLTAALRGGPPPTFGKGST